MDGSRKERCCWVTPWAAVIWPLATPRLGWRARAIRAASAAVSGRLVCSAGVGTTLCPAGGLGRTTGGGTRGFTTARPGVPAPAARPGPPRPARVPPPLPRAAVTEAQRPCPAPRPLELPAAPPPVAGPAARVRTPPRRELLFGRAHHRDLGDRVDAVGQQPGRTQRRRAK